MPSTTVSTKPNVAGDSTGDVGMCEINNVALNGIFAMLDKLKGQSVSIKSVVPISAVCMILTSVQLAQ